MEMRYPFLRRHPSNTRSLKFIFLFGTVFLVMNQMMSRYGVEEGSFSDAYLTSPETGDAPLYNGSPKEKVLTRTPRRRTVSMSRITKMVGMNPNVRKAFNYLDILTGKENNTFEGPPDLYRLFKSMVMTWNVEASKWALSTSASYKEAMVNRPHPEEEFFNFSEESPTDIPVTVEQCGCKRTVKGYSSAGEDVLPEDSTCSQHSFERGSHQRVIGFSFYGDVDSKRGKERKYFQGIKDNLEILPKYYDGWTLRLYYDLENNHPLMKDLCDLACKNPNIDLCYVKNIPAEGDISRIFPMNWRFMPITDPQVDIYVSRDLDSLLNSREHAAVQEWLKGNKAFHFMRDHPAHGIEVLGSGWGVRLGELERQFALVAFRTATKDAMFWAPRSSYGPDQGFLRRYLWPWGKWNSISHDSYSCTHFARTRPFPTMRKIEPNNFIASVVSVKDILRKKCPIKCRPKDHPEWIYC